MKRKTINSVLKYLKENFSEDRKLLDSLDYIEDILGEEIEELTPEGTFPLPKEINNLGDYALFSDGACRGNPGVGSWGVVAQEFNGDVLFESSSFEELTTNNKMELTGAIKSIELLSDYVELKSVMRVFLYTDSKYVCDGINSWIHNWKKRGWKKSDGKEVQNMDLWKRFDKLVESLSFFQCIWVKGHNGHPQNERCDDLCNTILDREFS